MKWDIFISHASEDKEQVARPLAELLSKTGLKVWLDENELTIGDSLRKKIDDGLAASRFGVVILSKAFFAKDWPQRELDALTSIEVKNRKVVLPVWHQVTVEEVKKHSPLLSDKLSINTNEGLEKIAVAIQNVVKNNSNFNVILGNDFHKALSIVEIDYSNDERGQLDVELDFKVDVEDIDTSALLGKIDKLWKPLTDFTSLLSGTSNQDIILGKVRTKLGKQQSSFWRTEQTNCVVQRSFLANSIANGIFDGFNAFLHLRRWQLYYDIDASFVDFYFSPYIKLSYDNADYIEPKHERFVATNEFLVKNKFLIADCVAEICQFALQEQVRTVAFKNPVWEDEIVPKSGMSGFWFKGIAQ